MNTLKSLLLLGRQPSLGIAELESIYSADRISPLGDKAAISDIAADEIDLNRLGGSIKLCHIISTLETTNWKQIEKAILKLAPSLFDNSVEGKIHLGLSVYGQKISPLDVHASALRVKKIVRAKTSRSVRVVPNTASFLSSAQVVHHKLVSTSGAEIVVFVDKNQAIIAKTSAEQDIEAYTKRDQARPKRDARVGMLPPKLAQIIINLATGNTVNSNPIVLDPFCGTGVILQEALIMGHQTIGTDLEPRMIDYTQKNIDWLNETHDLDGSLVYLDTGDATSHKWTKSHTISAVACEGYLGQPFNSFPSEDKLREVTHTCNQIMKGFLKNIHSQIETGTRLCIALPAWHRPNGNFEHLKFLDSLEELGYNRVSFVHTSTEDLLYYRPDQVVARELLIITRK